MIERKDFECQYRDERLNEVERRISDECFKSIYTNDAEVFCVNSTYLFKISFFNGIQSSYIEFLYEKAKHFKKSKEIIGISYSRNGDIIKFYDEESLKRKLKSLLLPGLNDITYCKETDSYLCLCFQSQIKIIRGIDMKINTIVEVNNCQSIFSFEHYIFFVNSKEIVIYDNTITFINTLKFDNPSCVFITIYIMIIDTY